jgi:ribose transport system ATP-binding protein
MAETYKTHAEMGLVCEGLTKTYNGITVVKDVSINVAPGKIVGLVGENGAGKSTTSNMIAGLAFPDSGKMTLNGVAYQPRTPRDALQAGVVLIHQEIRMVPHLSVAENIFLGRLPLKNGVVDTNRMNAETSEFLDLLGSRIDPRRPVGELSLASQQEIEIARALSRKPRFIIFDEPSSSLGDSETARVFEQIEALKDGGAGIIYISHRLDEVTRLADSVVCLRDGKMAQTWNTRNVSHDEIVKAMVGRDFTYGHSKPAPPQEKVVLKVENLGRSGVFTGVNFEVRSGEILGIAGLVGAGRTEVVRAIAGSDKATEGRISVDGQEVKISSPRDGIKAGVGMVPEDRKSQGLLLARNSMENMTLPWEKKLTKFGVVTVSKLSKIYDKHREDLDIRGQADVAVSRLSGGNQQKVLLAKWLIERPKVLILDEPTRGVDVGAKMTIYSAIRELALQGVAVVIVSSELEEVIGLSHRILVMSAGRQQGILDRDEATPETVMKLAVQGHGLTVSLPIIKN